MIFENLAKINQEADEERSTMRISFDAKVAVKIGELSRGGKSRKKNKAHDHDFAKESITPVGLYVPKNKDLSIYMVESKVTSDCCVDILEKWWSELPSKKDIKKLVVNLDNGPQQNSYTGQFMKRMQEFSNQSNIEVHLAYLPPYHSKYNPVEHTFGSLEKHWGSEILNSKDRVLGYAKTMSWAGKNPAVQLVTKVYETGVKVAKTVMKELENNFTRTQGIEKYSVLISPQINSS